MEARGLTGFVTPFVALRLNNSLEHGPSKAREGFVQDSCHNRDNVVMLTCLFCSQKRRHSDHEGFRIGSTTTEPYSIFLLFCI